MLRSRLSRVRRTPRAAALAIALLYGCAGTGPAPEDPVNWFDQLQQRIFDQHCLAAGCHNAQARAGGMDLSPGASYDQLVNVAPDNPAALKAGLLRVDPFAPDNSFLIVKLTAPGNGEGSRMPLGMDPLAQSDIDSLRAWILAGAPRTGTPPPTGRPTPPPPTATDTVPPSPTESATVTPTPVDTATATATVTGTAPPTSTPTVTPSPSPSPSPTPTGSLFEQIQTTIFSTTCVDAFCHDAVTMSGGMVLVEGQSYDNLVGVTPQNAAAAAAGFLRVDPGNPDNSFLLVKLDTPAPVFGSRMPFLKEPLSATQIALINDWIAQGAPP
jgi:hypothetical protein